MHAIKSSDQECETYSNIINSCSRFQIIGKRGEMIPICVYIKPDVDIKNSINGKIKVSVQKLLKSFGQGSGSIMRVAELIGNKNCKSACLILLPDRNLWLYHSENLLPKSTKEN